MTHRSESCIIPKHDHDAYIRGWCEMLDWRHIGLCDTPDNPYSRYYRPNQHYSFEAGVNDAYLYLIHEYEYDI